MIPQSRTQTSSRYPSYQRRLGTKCDSASLTGDVTSEIAKDDWERGFMIPSLSVHVRPQTL